MGITLLIIFGVSRCPLLELLDEHGRRSAASVADRRDPEAPRAFQHVEQSDQDSRAAAADGMANSNAPSHFVHLAVRDAQDSHVRDHHGSEGLVDLEDVDS